VALTGMSLSPLRAEIRDEIDHACRLFRPGKECAALPTGKLVADRVA
jgi:hypothetical protein